MKRNFTVALLSAGMMLSVAQLSSAVTTAPRHAHVDDSYAGSFFADPYTDPEEGVVKELQVIRVYFPNNEDEDLDEGWSGHATLENLTTGEVYETEKIEGLWSFGKITFPSAVTTPGEYVLTVDEGSWMCWYDDAESPEIKFYYTIEGAGEVEKNYFSDPIISPAPGEVSSLEEFVIEFPYLEGAKPEMEGFLWRFISLNDYSATACDVNDNNQLVITFDKMTVDGEYTLSILTGVVSYDGVDSSKMTFKYTLKYNPEDGVDMINADSEGCSVYDVAGRLVMTNSTSEAISNLQPGIYIINGKKYIKK